MFVSILEIMLAGLVIGAACVYTPHKQKMLSMLFILLFVCLFYLGFLVSSHQLVQGEGIPWIFNVLRIIITLGLIVSALISYMPYQGFFHAQSMYSWLAVASLFFFIGWHAGHWFNSLFIFIAFIVVYIIFYMGGNAGQGMIHLKIRQKWLAPFVPFSILLLFSVIMLL